MQQTDQLLMIRRHDFFAQLTNEDYESLNILHNYKEAKKNEYIYFESHLQKCLYFVKDGFVKIGYIDKDGNEIIKEIIGSNDIFGQITLDERKHDGEFAQAYKADVSLCMFRIEDFIKLLGKHPQLAISFSKQVGNKVSKLENRMINLLQKDVKSRLIYYFYSLTQQYKTDIQNNSIEIPNFITHDDLARLIGSCRQTVTTTLSQIMQEGIVQFTRSHIRVGDIKKLQNLLSV